MEESLKAWSADDYARHTAHHRAHDSELLAGLTIAPDHRILDVGCGVGELAETLADLVPQGQVVGADASQEMINRAARRERANLSFLCCAAQQLDRCVEPGRFDLVVSTAALHWVPADDQPAVLRHIARALRPGGVFRAEFGGHGQIAAAREILDAESQRVGGPVDPWYFPDAQTYRTLLADAGLRHDPARVRLIHQRRTMTDADALLGWLRSQVLIAYTSGMSADQAAAFRDRAEQRAVTELRRPDGTWDQDYVRLDLLATAPNPTPAATSR